MIGLTDPGAYGTLAESEDARTAAEPLTTDRARIVARAAILTRSGQRAASPRSLEPGLSLQADPILGPDGSTIDLPIDLKFGLRVAPGDLAALTGGLKTSVTVRSGRPVPQRLNLEGAPWPEIALVLSATVKLVGVDGWKNGVLRLLPREQEWRALGTRAAEGAGK